MSLTIYWINESLGIMPAPNGKELAAEIRQLKELGVDLLVSLLPEDEAARLGLENQEELCRITGISLLRFPIGDFNVPGDKKAALDAVSEVSEMLRKGHKVVVHCRGGIGRSSIFSGALLVMEGEDPESAFKMIEKCRGCKVPETEAQALWLKAFENYLRNR